MLEHEYGAHLEEPSLVAETCSGDVVGLSAGFYVEFEDGVRGQVDEFCHNRLAVPPFTQAGEMHHVLEDAGRVP